MDFVVEHTTSTASIVSAVDTISKMLSMTGKVDEVADEEKQETVYEVQDDFSIVVANSQVDIDDLSNNTSPITVAVGPTSDSNSSCVSSVAGPSSPKLFAMPLIVITGLPSSGKTTRTNEIKNYFEKQGKEVHVVSEEEQILKAGFEKDAFYLDSSKEKHIRALLKSEVVKLLGPNSLVILDGSNYIKGYRYELYCASKGNKCTQCTVYTGINTNIAWNYNEAREEQSLKYSLAIFDALVLRYEEPIEKNRWDSPLFMVFPEQILDMKAIYECLFEKKPPPPNQSTQNVPLSDTNFLYDLDKITKDITDSIMKAKSMGAKGDIKIPGCDNLKINVSNISVSQLMLLRRQYIIYSKLHAPEVSQVPQLYIQYLKSSFNL
ncbi:hypothetical protein FQA39_LY11725 [Lamprigera yunnana]|nr:hypothetical protein FQA39_LY11725 [Lamprigera yunnana]